MKLFFISS